jgi:hypothetical protein
LTPALWIEAKQQTFQSNAGTTPASANSDPVGYIGDLSGAGFHMTSVANDTTRPLLQGVGVFPYLDFTSANSQTLRRAADIGSYAAGATTWAIVQRGNPATADRLK